MSLGQFHTLKRRQTGMPMPVGMAEEKIPDFPTPGGVIDELAAGTKRQMLERLHMGYKYLCYFAAVQRGGHREELPAGGEHVRARVQPPASPKRSLNSARFIRTTWISCLP